VNKVELAAPTYLAIKRAGQDDCGYPYLFKF